VHDITIARAKFIQKLAKTSEKALGDLGYQGEPEAIITPHRAPTSLAQFDENEQLHKIRSAVEREFAALKTFAVLRTKWRGELDSHIDAFYACCVLRELQKLVSQRKELREL